MNNTSRATNKLLTLSMLKGVGPSALRKISMIANFESVSHEALAEHVPSLDKALKGPISWERAVELSEDQLAKAESNDVQVISSLDDEYPQLLMKSKDNPFLLFVKGKLSPDPVKSVAIIGTRKPTEHGALIATRITRYFVENDWSVVSGLALGCDTVAHETAIAAGGHTVAVLAHGLHTIAPERNKQLAEEILDSGGALVSEYLFGQDVRPEQFVKRDRTQAGLASGVVMIQSGLNGGSLHASRAALRYNRWLAVPSLTEVDRSTSEPIGRANLLLAEGTNEEKIELLRCETQQLEQLMIIESKEDYPKLINQTDERAPLKSITPEQGSLI